MKRIKSQNCDYCFNKYLLKKITKAGYINIFCFRTFYNLYGIYREKKRDINNRLTILINV